MVTVLFVSVSNSVSLLQLGAGVSLPGVVAAKCGARVVLSDTAELPLCLKNCRRSCDVNNLPSIPVIGLTWGQVSPELISLPPVDIILGSDVFYEPEGEHFCRHVFFLDVLHLTKQLESFAQILKMCS